MNVKLPPCDHDECPPSKCIKPIEPSVEPLRGWYLKLDARLDDGTDEIKEALAAYDQLKAENEALRSEVAQFIEALKKVEMRPDDGQVVWEHFRAAIDDHQTACRLLGVKAS